MIPKKTNFNRIRSAVYGGNCYKCDSSDIVMLLERKYLCNKCNIKFSPKILSENLMLLFCFYNDMSMNKVSQDFQLSYNKVKRNFENILQLISNDFDKIIRPSVKSIYIQPIKTKIYSNYYTQKDIQLICVYSNNYAIIINSKLIKNKISSKELNQILDNNNMKIISSSVEFIATLKNTYPDKKVDYTNIKNPLELKFINQFADKMAKSRGCSPELLLFHQVAILYKLINKDKLFEKLITLLSYPKND